jgi:hypothetical protein
MTKAKWGLLFLALGVTALLSRAPGPPLRRPDAAPVLPRASTLLALFSSHRQLLADFYWLQATYRTGLAGTASEYRDIAYYTQLITDLDPDFLYAYKFGTIVPPYNLGRETWVNTAESTAMVEKGLARFPDDLQLRMLHGFNLGYFDRRFQAAADEMVRASKLPGAPEYLPALATRMYATSDAFDTALALAEAFIAQAGDEETRAFYERRRQEILLERVLKTVDHAAREFHERTGRMPATVVELYVAGDLEVPAVDPLGGDIVLDEKGKAHSTVVGKRLQVFVGHGKPLE